MDELQNIQNLIYVIRGQRVMFDFDLAMLYEVETRSLNQTVNVITDDFQGISCSNLQKRNGDLSHHNL